MGTIPTTPTLTAGQVLPAATLNQICDVIDFWALTPRASVYQTTATTFSTSGTFFLTSFDTELFDTDSIHSTSSNTSRLVCQTAGKYLISGQVSFTSNATGNRLATIRLNAAGNSAGGTLLQQQALTAVGGGNATVCAFQPFLYPLSVGDYVEMFGAQSSGGSLVGNSGISGTWLSMKLDSQ